MQSDLPFHLWIPLDHGHRQLPEERRYTITHMHIFKKVGGEESSN